LFTKIVKCTFSCKYLEMCVFLQAHLKMLFIANIFKMLAWEVLQTFSKCYRIILECCCALQKVLFKVGINHHGVCVSGTNILGPPCQNATRFLMSIEFFFSFF